MALFMIEKMVAFPFLPDPWLFGGVQFGSDFLFVVVCNFIVDVPINVCTPWHILVRSAFKILPGKSTNGNGVAELWLDGKYLEGKKLRRIFHAGGVKIFFQPNFTNY